jgi:hypothetical protein
MVKATDLLLPATAGSIAVCFTNPLELTKGRLQLDNERAVRGTARQYAGWVDCVAKNFQSDGIRGLQRGLGMAMQREFIFNGLRIGMYDHMLSLVHGAFGRSSEGPSGGERLGAGLACGALGAATCNPWEVIKVRMQIQGGKTGHQHQYEGQGAAWRSLLRDEGIAGLSRGIGVSTLRGTVGPGSQLFSYNEFKRMAVERGAVASDHSTHIMCALASAVVSIVVVNPTDVVRTRLFNAPDGWCAPRHAPAASHPCIVAGRCAGTRTGWTARSSWCATRGRSPSTRARSRTTCGWGRTWSSSSASSSSSSCGSASRADR